MITCPSCRKPVDPRLTRCPWDSTLLRDVIVDRLLGTAIGGRYLLHKSIGERGPARLYTARDEAAKGMVLATVLLHPELNAASFQRFRDRAERLSTVDHAGCSPIRDYGKLTEVSGVFVIEGGEVWHQLRQELVLKGRLPPSRALDLVGQLLEALDHLHGLGVHHGALSPDSLRLTFDARGALKLQLPTSEVALQEIAPLTGELDQLYRPPRDLQGPPADLYAVVMIMAEMLTGLEPAQLREGQFGSSKLDLDEDSQTALRQIVEQGLGRCGAPYSSVWSLRRDLEPLTGRSRFGRYDLLHRIAVGGMGDIYLARAVGIEGLDLYRMCVIKTVRTNLVASSEFVDRFVAEARVLASLSHGNIVPVYDVGKVGSIFYIAMEYVKGQDLRRLLTRGAKEKRRMPVPLALFIARELANGLAYAHRAKVQGIGGLVHRDVSPHNILVSYDGEVKLIDFGLAQLANDLPEQGDGVVMGKVCYLSPEQARAEALDQRTDIYSAGLVLFEMLTGEPFFNQPTIAEVLNYVAIPQVEAPSARAPDIPLEVDRICLRAMAPSRDDRYNSAGALRDDLTAALARIAARTNPEAIGEYVRGLFPSEQRDEETLLSDLSMTMPPVAPGQEDRSSGGIVLAGLPAGEQSAAISLLNQSPKPIQLASTLWPGKGKDQAQASSGTVAEQRAPDPHQREGTLKTTVLVDALPSSGWRRSLPVLIGLIVALAGGAGVFGVLRLSQREKEAQAEGEREAAREAFKRLASWTVAKQSAQEPPPAASEAAAAPAADRSERASSRRKASPTRRPQQLLLSKTQEPACYLQITGKQGLTLEIDGGKIITTLPLAQPLMLEAKTTHQIVVKKAGLRSFKETVSCQPGERLKLRLRVR